MKYLNWIENESHLVSCQIVGLSSFQMAFKTQTYLPTLGVWISWIPNMFSIQISSDGPQNVIFLVPYYYRHSDISLPLGKIRQKTIWIAYFLNVMNSSEFKYNKRVLYRLSLTQPEHKQNTVGARNPNSEIRTFSDFGFRMVLAFGFRMVDHSKSELC